MPIHLDDPAARRELRKTGYTLQHKQDTTLAKVDLHHHDFYEFYFLLSGEVTCTVESRLYRVTPGDILLISPRELHKLHIFTSVEGYERFVLWFDMRTVKELCSQQTDLLSCLDLAQPGHHNQLHMTPEEQQLLYGLLRRFEQERQADAFGRDLMTRALLLQILVAVNRVAAHQEIREEDPVLTNPVISSVVEYIGTHYGQPLTLEGLAERFFISKYHLSHEFSRFVGTSVHRYIKKKRLLTARGLMAQGKHPGEVWETCGFGDYTSFYRAFQAEYGMPPSDYANAVLLELQSS